MSQKLQLIGIRFGRLLVTSCAGKTTRGHYRWNVLCDCGKNKTVLGYHLVHGSTTSCGCKVIEMASELGKLVSNKTHGMGGTAEYRAYIGAKGRCENPNIPGYRYYGGRGIKFLFSSFEEFFAELGLRPSPKHSIDRIDNNGHYEIGNVRWATSSQQCSNRRPKGKSGAIGVTQLSSGRWRSRIAVNGKLKSIGCYETPAEAIAATRKYQRSGK